MTTRDLILKLFFTIMILIGAFFIGLIVWVITLLEVPVWLVLPIALFCAALLFTLVCLVWNRPFLYRVRYVPLGAVGLCALIGWGGFLMGVYDSNIPVHHEQGVDLNAYEPFYSDNLAALSGPASLQLEGDLPKLDCATALYPVAAAFVQATYPHGHYAPHDVNNTIFRQTDTEQAYARLLDGDVDMIFVAGPSQSQLQEARERGVELTFTPIGREAFVFFVHSRNPVDSLSLVEIQRIYSGELTNWNQVGGRNNEILAFQRPENSGSQTALQNMMDGKPLMTPPQDQIAGGMGDIIERTSSYKNYKNALGYSFLYFATEMVEDSKIKLLAVDGVAPNRETIASLEYPLASEFYAVTTQISNPKCPSLLEWILSEEGQDLIEQTGYVGIG